MLPLRLPSVSALGAALGRRPCRVSCRTSLRRYDLRAAAAAGVPKHFVTAEPLQAPAPPDPCSEVSLRPLLLLVDGHYLAHRSYHSSRRTLPEGLATKDGVPTNITYMSLKLLGREAAAVKADGVVFAFDTSAWTFRHALDPAYKSARKPLPPGFTEDLGNLKRILDEGLGVVICEAHHDFEGDDALGTLACRAVGAGWRVRVLSGDRDLFQLVDDVQDVACLFPPMRHPSGTHSSSEVPDSVLVRESNVKDCFGVPASQLVDYKALAGDRVDGFLGVRGIGPKRAAWLLQRYRDITEIFRERENLPKPYRRLLSADDASEIAERCRQLSRIRLDMPLSSDFPDLRPRSSPARLEHLRVLFEKLEFHSYLKNDGASLRNLASAVECRKELLWHLHQPSGS